MNLLCAIALGLSLGLAGCGDDDGGDEPEGPAVEGFTYSKSGGIAGISEHVAIEENGETTIESGNVDPVTKTFTLPASELAKLNSQLDDAGFDDIESPGDDTGCADCFIYVIERGDHSVTFDSSNFPDELTPVVADLEKLLVEQADSVK